MDLFYILQMLFDAVLFFGILFLFHYSVHQSQKKTEEGDILKNIQVQEIKENLQELLLTLKQLGKEVSDNIQEQVREAEEKTELFKKVVAKLQKDLRKAAHLAGQVELEKKHLEEKLGAIETAKGKPSRPEDEISRELKKDDAVPPLEKEFPRGLNFDNATGGHAFSSGLVKEVYRLCDEQMKISEIVQRTKLSRAEVQLILNLRGNGFTASN